MTQPQLLPPHFVNMVFGLSNLSHLIFTFGIKVIPLPNLFVQMTSVKS